MKNKIDTLFDYIKRLSESDLDRIIKFVLGILFVNQRSESLPDYPRCGESHVVKFGHRNGKQRFMCHDCERTFMHTTNTLMTNSHYGQSILGDFIRDTLYGKTLDDSVQEYNFSHQTAFNIRHKVLMALQDLSKGNPVLLFGISEFDETFVLDCYKGSPVPEEAGREARKHGAKAAKRGISSEYIAICTGIQSDGGAVAATVNRAKPSSKELSEIFHGHIADASLVLTDGLRSYHVFESFTNCTVIDINHKECHGIFHLNTVDSLHLFIKETYNHYRGVATKYLNRYNALFSIAFRCANNLKDTLFSSLCTVGQKCYWHSVKDVRNHQLLLI